MMARPPRLASWLVTAALPERRQEELVGDMEELFHERRIERGAVAARRWYWRQTVNTLIDEIRERRRNPRPHGDSPMQMILQDLKFAVRSLKAKPGFSAIAILMLALGIGANATIFSWVNSVLLNPIPGGTRTTELVELAYLYKGDTLTSISYPDYKDISSNSKLLSGITGFDDLAVGVVIDKEAERAWAEIVTGNFFDVLGVPIALGRGFGAADDVPGAPAGVVISYDYWRSRFNADPAAVGRQISINTLPFTIIGVTTPAFNGPLAGVAYDMWLPMGSQATVMPGGDRLNVRGSRWMVPFARLAPGATVEQARAEFDSILEQMRKTSESQERYLDHRAGIFTLDNAPEGGTSVLRPVLLILMVVAGVVLLITCANLAGLLLARASARQREIAIRLSMGAGRWRIIQQLLVEGTLLASLGSIAALIALQWTSGLLAGFAPPSELPIRIDVTIDARVMWFTAAVAIGTVILFALAPAAQATPADVGMTLRDSGSSGRTFTRHRLRRALVAAQVALSIALLVGAGLCIRSLDAAARMTPGFEAKGVTVGWLDMFAAGYKAQEGRAFYARVLDRVRAIPGVESASYMRRIPLGFIGGSSSDVTVEGHEAQANDPQSVNLNYVGPDYARTLRIPVIAGRDLSQDDVFERPRVALVSEAMARIYWKDRDPIGGRFMFGRPRPDQEPQWITVVGVTKDIKVRRLTERGLPFIAIPILQFYASSAVLTVRASGGPESIGGDLQRILREVDPRVPFYNLSKLEDHVKAATFQQKMAGDLLVIFGALALVLAGIGSYGVLSYLVGMRRREIGIRLAVGATRADVFRLIAGSGFKLIGTGLVAGLLLSVGVGMGLQSMLIGISPTDPLTYAGVVGVLGIVAAAACLMPARRAAGLDPMTTLRED